VLGAGAKQKIMTTQHHSFIGSNGNHLYERKYLGEGKYYQRGICKGISEGDEFTCFTAPKTTLIVDKVISIKNSKGTFKKKEDAENSLYEAELTDNAFEPRVPNYQVLGRI
jgi:hypothetical protein